MTGTSFAAALAPAPLVLGSGRTSFAVVPSSVTPPTPPPPGDGSYEAGSLVTVSVNFFDATGKLADPSTVTLTVQQPDKTRVDWVVQRLAQGVYLSSTIPLQIGVFQYVWKGFGALTAVQAGSFIILDPFVAVTSDVYLRPAAPHTATAGNQLGAAIPSLGGFVATVLVDQTTLQDNLFNDLSSDQNAAQQVDYRCVFVHNASTTNTLFSVVLWILSEIAAGASTAVAVDNLPASPLNSSAPQSGTILSPTTAPTGVSAFSAPTTKATGLRLGDIAPGSVKAFWIQRKAHGNVGFVADGVTLRIEGDTI